MNILQEVVDIELMLKHLLYFLDFQIFVTTRKEFTLELHTIKKRITVWSININSLFPVT